MTAEYRPKEMTDTAKGTKVMGDGFPTSTCTNDECQKAPFPWFGGKRRVADEVWEALGDVQNYAEPFAGSLAVLLGRPHKHECKAETVNDKDAYLSNFWRALAADPEAVAAWCDWPVNETDLFARHL